MSNKICFLRSVVPVASMLILATGCGDPSVGSADSFSPILERRYKVIAGGRLIQSQYRPEDPEYQVGELLYAEAYSSTNSVLQQILTSLNSETTLPEPDGPVDCSVVPESRDGETVPQVSILCNIENAISDSDLFFKYVTDQICTRPDNSDLCNFYGLQERNSITDLLPIPDLAKSLFTAINESIKFARENREARRQELISRYQALILPEFQLIGEELSSPNAATVED